MRRIDFRPSVIESRIYDKGGYKEKIAYRGSFIIHIIDDTAYITLLTGVCEEDKCTWDMELTDELMEYLKERECKILKYEHKGKKVVREVV